MSEEIIEQEVQPEIQPEVEQIQEPQEQTQEQSEQTQSNFEHNALEDNLRSLREGKAQAEHERDQMAKYIENMQQQANPVQQKEQNYVGVQDDDYVEGRHLGKVANEMTQMRQELNQWKNYSEEMTAELKLNSEFSDFSSVVTASKVKAFIDRYPEMRGSIHNNDPLYNRGKATYRLIKKFMGDNVKQPVNANNQRAVQNNTGKPRPTSSINEQQNSPLSQANSFANGYNEDIGSALEDEMYEAIKRY